MSQLWGLAGGEPGTAGENWLLPGGDEAQAERLPDTSTTPQFVPFAMPTRSRRPDLLIDTSVAVALVVADHESHKVTTQAVGQRRLGLAGHAAFETFSVLTRLPAPARRTPAAVARILSTNFPGSRHLSAAASAALLERLAEEGIAGDSVYDALVGAVAAEHHLVLATRDRRALDTYRALGIEVDLLPER